MAEKIYNGSRRHDLIAFIVIFGFALALRAVCAQWTPAFAGPISLIVVLGVVVAYLRHQRRSLASIGLVPLGSARRLWLLVPQSVLTGVVIIGTGLLVGMGGEALGLSFMAPDASGPAERFGDLAGNTPRYLLWLVVLWIAGPAEELYFRGFMITQLQRVFGRGRLSTAAAVLVPAILFGFGHFYYQGIRGFVVTGAIGLSLGLLFLAYRRNLWPLMIGHAAVNSLVFTAQYLEWDI